MCQLSIYNSFPVIRTTIAKNRHFYVSRPSFFVCPGDAPASITQNVARMKRQFSACETPRSMYPSIFNSFTVIRTASENNRSFHVPQPTFLFPLETPLRLSRNVLHGWKGNSMLVKPLAACTGAYAGFHFGRGWMASAEARACNGWGSGGCAPSGVQGQSPWWEVTGASPPEAESYLL